MASSSNPARDVARSKLDYGRPRSSYGSTSRSRCTRSPRAAASEQDAALSSSPRSAACVSASFSAFRVRDVDFAGDTIRVLRSIDIREGVSAPEERKGRSVPLARPSRQSLARLPQPRALHRPRRLVFVGIRRPIPRRLRPPSPLPGRAEDGEAPADPVSRPPPHIRRSSRPTPRRASENPGVARARRPPHDGALPALPAAKTAAQRIGRIFTSEQAQAVSVEAPTRSDD